MIKDNHYVYDLEDGSIKKLIRESTVNAEKIVFHYEDHEEEYKILEYSKPQYQFYNNNNHYFFVKDKDENIREVMVNISNEDLEKYFRIKSDN